MGRISFGDTLDWDGTLYPNPSSAIDGAINMVSTSRYTAKSDPVELTETTDQDEIPVPRDQRRQSEESFSLC